tara:strand:+ start:348 stop:566 length:219 start_codon:yes stop_codon:yes gene_type:complete
MYSRKYIIILIYITLLLLLFLIKPSLLFDDNGNIKNFGFESNNNKSLLSIEILIPILAIISYIIYMAIDIII